VADFVQRLRKIHDEGVCLFSFLYVLAHIVDEFYKLSFTGESPLEAMLQWIENVVVVRMDHDVACYNMFH